MTLNAHAATNLLVADHPVDRPVSHRGVRVARLRESRGVREGFAVAIRYG